MKRFYIYYDCDGEKIYIMRRDGKTRVVIIAEDKLGAVEQYIRYEADRWTPPELRGMFSAEEV